MHILTWYEAIDKRWDTELDKEIRQPSVYHQALGAENASLLFFLAVLDCSKGRGETEKQDDEKWRNVDIWEMELVCVLKAMMEEDLFAEEVHKNISYANTIREFNKLQQI